MKRAGARLLLCGMHTNWGRRAGVGVGRVIALWHNNDGIVKASIQTRIVIAQIRFLLRLCGN